MTAGAVAARDHAATSWPLVGRAEELDFVWDALRGGAPGVVLSGPPGVGKTRLARHIGERARSAGWSVDTGAGTEAGRDMPFAAIAALTPEAGTGRPPSEVEKLTGFAAALRSRAAGRPALLVVDDVHLVDRATAALIGQVCSTGDARVLLTLRRGRSAPDAVTRLWKDRIVHRLEVQPLAAAQLVELLHAVLGGVVEAPTRQLLWQATGGNVFLLRELVQTGLDSGRLTGDGGVWHWEGPLDIGASATELVASHLARLSTAERTALELVALGDPLDLSAALACDTEEALISLEREGLVITARATDGRLEVRLAHPLYGEGVRSAMPVLAARSTRRTLARILEDAGLPGPHDALRVAVWRLDAGLGAPPGLLLRAGRQARSLADHQLCERLARAAITAGGGFPAELLLAGSLAAQGRWTDAERQCTTGTLAEPTGSADACRVALIRAEVLFWGFGRAGQAMQLLERSAAAAGGDPAAECSALRGTLALFTGELELAAAAAADALDTAGVSDRTVVRAILCSVPALALGGDTSSAIERAGRAWAVLDAGVETPAPWRADLLIGHTAALRAAGRLVEAGELATEYHRSALAAYDHTCGTLALLAMGAADLDTGDVASAIFRLTDAAALLRRFDQLGLLPWCLSLLVRAAACAGQPDLAASTVEELEVVRRRSSPLFAAEAARAALWAAVAAGRRSDLTEIGVRAAEQAGASGQWTVQAAILHDLVRLGQPAAAVTGLSELAARCDGALVPVFAEHAAALLVNDGERLDAAGAAFAGLGARLLGAEAAAQAAVAHQSAGMRAAAVGSRQRAEEHRAACPGARTPALERAPASPLTAREHEVAVLAGRGLPNTEIAARLQLSVRTVEGHLQQAYLKLDVHRREELPTL